jgi:hypothetical protein
MRAIPLSSIALVSFVVHASAAEPPRLPDSINVAGGDFQTTEYVAPRAPKNLETLSGIYDSHSITDGRQWLELKVHRGVGKTWLVDGTITTQYRPQPPETVSWTNAPLTVSGELAWFQTGIPKLVGHAVIYRKPDNFPQEAKGAPQPAIIMGDSVYLPDPKAKSPRGEKPVQKRSTAAQK